MSELQAGWMLSLLLGARHALEPDHVAAVTSLLTTERGRPATLGMLWGVGHALALFVVASVLSVLRGLPLRPSLRLLLTTGFCGGFTTYSTFNFETVSLVEQRGLFSGLGYAATTLSLCLCAHVLAAWIARSLRPA